VIEMNGMGLFDIKTFFSPAHPEVRSFIQECPVININKNILFGCSHNGYVTVTNAEYATFEGIYLPYELLYLFSLGNDKFWGLFFEKMPSESDIESLLCFGRAITELIIQLTDSKGVVDRLVQTNRQQREEVLAQLEQISAQSEEIKRKNQDINDSLIYASRIQGTILQDAYSLKQHLKDSFVVYRPKDHLSGDFYWWGKVDHKLILVVADCTGHGVPGAMISLLGINTLNNILIETRETDPAQILTLMNFRLICSLQPDNADFKLTDGMEMCVCTIDLNSGKMQFAGANSSLYHERFGVLNVIEGNRLPIAGLPLPNESDDILMRQYETKELQLQSQDRVYMVTDGLFDQHGVSNSGKVKKLGRKQMILAFQQYRQLTFDQIVQHLNEDVDNWQKQLEQTDDILAIGFQFN
jgi:serine phosphatase RsbU (regulator of sigma subunit)